MRLPDALLDTTRAHWGITGDTIMRRPFVETLRELRQGQVTEQLDAALQALTQAVAATGKGGSIKLTMTIKPLKGSDAVTVLADVESKTPVYDDVGTLMFVTPEGNLSRSNHERQPELPGITLATAAGERA